MTKKRPARRHKKKKIKRAYRLRPITLRTLEGIALLTGTTRTGALEFAIARLGASLNTLHLFDLLGRCQNMLDGAEEINEQLVSVRRDDLEAMQEVVDHYLMDNDIHLEREAIDAQDPIEETKATLAELDTLLNPVESQLLIRSKEE